MIYEKLQKARVELQNLKLSKSGKNKYANFDYFELKDFLPAVNEIFLKLKMSSNFSIVDTIATLKVIDFEDNTQAIFTSPTEELELKGCNRIQALGGAHTYIKRYLYLNALEIVENDLFDSTVQKDKKASSLQAAPAPVRATKTHSPRQQLYNMLKSKNFSADEMNEFCKIHDVTPDNTADFLKSEDLNLCIEDYIKTHKGKN